MRYRHSLRFRILVAFVAMGVILGPVLTLGLLGVTYILEERAVERQVAQHLQEVIAAPDDYALRSTPQAPGLKLLSSTPVKQLPPDMFALPDGMHEYESHEGAWYVAIGSGPRGRYGVIADISALENREQVGLFVVAGASLVTVYLALWLGYLLSRRLLAPLIQLADTVARNEFNPNAALLSEHFAEDEVGDLARALDRYRQRMIEALARERTFSADASHELRNPLAVIQSAAELILADPAAGERAQRTARRIHTAAVNMSETVAALLLLARDPESPTEEQPVDVAECIAPLITAAREQATGSVSISWHRHANPVVRGPRIAVQTVAANIIRNAVQYTHEGSIDIVLEDDRLSVADSGIGIPVEDLTTVTVRGTRASNTIGEGSGLGLSLVARLCERFGWKFRLDSKLGYGSRAEWRFDFTNP